METPHKAGRLKRRLELWGGVECSVVRLGSDVRDQVRETGHQNRQDDLNRIAALGIQTLRYPVLVGALRPRPPQRLRLGLARPALGRAAAPRDASHRRAGASRRRAAARAVCSIPTSPPAWPRMPRSRRALPVPGVVDAGERAADDRPVQLPVRPLVSASARRGRLPAGSGQSVPRRAAGDARHPAGDAVGALRADGGSRPGLRHAAHADAGGA